MRLFLVRHGRQSDTRCNVDVGLAAEGVEQARLAGQRMRSWGIESLVSSDLVRARETADVMNEHLDVLRHIIPSFKELDFGEMQGCTDEEIAERFGDFQQRQAALDLDLTYPGGENIAQLLERVVPECKALARGNKGPVAVVTHGVVIRSLVAYVTHAPAARWRMVAHGLENGSITEIEWHESSEEFSLERLNDYAHLEAHPELLRAAWGVSEN